MDDPRRLLRLLDIVVAILFVSLLCLLLVMIVSREPGHGHRFQCQNNLKNVVLGLIGFQFGRGAFPNSGTFDDDLLVHGGDPGQSTIYRAVVASRHVRERSRFPVA